MANKRTVLVCDNEDSVLSQIQSDLQKEGFEVHILKDAGALVATAERMQPTVVVANPDMTAFNEDDVCKKIKQDMNIRVILLLDPHSTRRAQIGECDADDVITKPVETDLLANLVEKHISLHQ
jgi:DNA-binding response OmpR family regulator